MEPKTLDDNHLPHMRSTVYERVDGATADRLWRNSNHQVELDGVKQNKFNRLFQRKVKEGGPFRVVISPASDRVSILTL